MSDLADRFRETWSALAPVGRNAETGGYRRFAWTDEDAQLRSWFADQARARDMTYRVDRNGNQWAWWGPPARGAVVSGSHLDSVPDGGAFDGPLGVASAFFAIDELRARQVQPRRPIAVVNCADEEGARFGVACLGSRLMAGAISPERARELRDDHGTTLAAAMQSAGVDPGGLGLDEQALGWIGAFVELHVEQGRALVDLDRAVGVASAIWPHGRWRLEFRGEANHAGTTRMVDRRDPMVPFATTVLEARDVATENGAVATVGRVRVTPNGTNAIPSAVDAWLDARAADQATLTATVDAVVGAAEQAAATNGTTVQVREESVSSAVDFDSTLRDRIHGLLDGAPILPTGAGHDAGVLSLRVPTAMLFVRNPTGVSHSPAEFAEQADCVAGVGALATVLADLARR